VSGRIGIRKLTSLFDDPQGKELANALLATVSSLNRRTMDQLSSKVYFYWVRLHELAGDDTAPLRTYVPLCPPSSFLLPCPR
jgi:hypothetical protein